MNVHLPSESIHEYLHVAERLTAGIRFQTFKLPTNDVHFDDRDALYYRNKPIDPKALGGGPHLLTCQSFADRKYLVLLFP